MVKAIRDVWFGDYHGKGLQTIMNIAIIQGRPTRDPEIVTSERTGKVYCQLTIACDRPYRGKDAPKKADFFRVTCFGKLAQTVYNNLAKGALCTVLGRLAQDEYVDRVGNKRESVNIIASRITIHEWLRKSKVFEELGDIDNLVPREITNSLIKQIDFSDEDLPEDIGGGNIDDLF